MNFKIYFQRIGLWKFFLIIMRIEIKNKGPFLKEIKPENGIFELTKSQIVKGNYLDIYFNNKRLIVKL